MVIELLGDFLLTGRQFSPMVLVDGNGSTVLLNPVGLQPGNGQGAYSEAWIRNLLFCHPETLPVDEIEPGFGPLVPICTELNMGAAGTADALYANHLGMLTLAEFKLWRNPEARREVIGQILDYARVLRRWSYTDLQREVARALKRQGLNALLDRVRERHPQLDEARFIDSVSRTLRNGRFLLLVIGDGIREGVEAIAEYVQAHAGLHFTFGLIEAPVFELNDGRRLVQPRILARTLIINRSVVEVAKPDLTVSEDSELAETEGPVKRSALEEFRLAFWTEFLSQLRFDDADQPVPRPLALGSVAFMLPTNGNMWVTAYLSFPYREIGCYLGYSKTSDAAPEILARLESMRQAIEAELGIPIEWKRDQGNGKLYIIAKQSFTDLADPEERAEKMAWLGATVNRFVNVFRPRIGNWWRELNSGSVASD